MKIVPCFWFLVISLAAVSCATDTGTESAVHQTPALSASSSITIDAGTYTDSFGEIGSVKPGTDLAYTTASGESWLAYDVVVPEAGRYEVVLTAAAMGEGATAWIEDYYENPDGRTYNITGSIDLAMTNEVSNSFERHTKTGSPLNAGTHKMKLHLKGDVRVEKFEFTLIKPHVPTPVSLKQNMSGEEWVIVWSDEFDGTGLPDTSKWTFDIGDWGWGNNELQYYTENRVENARLEGGNLIIEARKNDEGNKWTSARLTTRGKVAFTYGRIEFRARVPKEKGNWAAGWTLGDSYVDEISWPYCGEIDILESVGYEMDDATGDGKAHASAHCGAYYFKLGNQPTGIIDVKNMNEAFQTYAVDWGPDGMTASVDGISYFTYNDTSTPLSWPFDKPQNIILNLAMGGGWGGLQGMDESVTSQKFVLDYVRVYEKR
jgi:beta-glucanase (GH16 family)